MEELRVKDGIKPDPNTVHPIPGYDKEIYVKPTIKDSNIIVGDFTYIADSEFECYVTHHYPNCRSTGTTSKPIPDRAYPSNTFRKSLRRNKKSRLIRTCDYIEICRNKRKNRAVITQLRYHYPIWCG